VASTWGSTALKILVGTLKPGVTPGPLTKNPVLPDPADLSKKVTVIQQKGRESRQEIMKLYVTSEAAYEAFLADMNAGTQRTLTIDNTSINGTYLIESLDPDYIQADCVEFNIVFLEV